MMHFGTGDMVCGLDANSGSHDNVLLVAVVGQYPR